MLANLAVLLISLYTVDGGLYRGKDFLSCFTLYSSSFLEKAGSVLIEDVDDVNECLKKCVQSQISYDMKCKTAMYNVNAKSCILSKYSTTEKQLKVAKSLQIDLYENRCAKGVSSETIRLGHFTEQVRTTTSLPTSTQVSSLDARPIPELQKTLTDLRRLALHAVKQYNLESVRDSASLGLISKLSNGDETKIVSRRQNSNENRFHSPDVINQQAAREQQAGKDHEKCFKLTPKGKLRQFEEATHRNVSLHGCLTICLISQSFYCASVNYSPEQKLCVLNGGNTQLSSGFPIMSNTFDYYENICPPPNTVTKREDSGRPTAKECYRLYNNTLLNSFDATILKGLKDLESCEQQCSWWRLKKQDRCTGVNFIQATGACMLFHAPSDFSLLKPSSGTIFLNNICPQEPIQRSRTRSGSVSNDYYDST